MDNARQATLWVTVPAIALVVSMATLVHAFLIVKLVLIAVFLTAAIVDFLLRRNRLVVYPRILTFYLCVAVAGIVWAIVGLMHPANYVQGVYDALRLYLFWSIGFAILYTLFRATVPIRTMHWAICVAGIAIPLINFLAFYDLLRGTSLLPAGVRQQLALEIGLADGYVQLGSVNISTMFVVAPYLLAVHLRGDPDKPTNFFSKVALVLSLVLVAVSGRRALWIVVALTPGIILLLAWITRASGMMGTWARRFLIVSTAAGVIGLGGILLMANAGSDMPVVEHVRDAFSAEDERTIQRPYLLGGFLESPAFGSGFGKFAGYTRNEEKPWTYELTYDTMLLNLGMIGTGLLLVLFSSYFASVVGLLKRFKSESAVPFALLVAFCGLLLGAYSNPYLGGFDSLFFAGLLPYLSSFQRGFTQPVPMPEGVL